MLQIYRKYITTGVGFTFFVVGTTGLFMKFAFKNHSIEEVHTWIGIAMSVFAVIHTIQNWRSLTMHLQYKKTYLLLIPILLVIAGFTFSASKEPKSIGPKEVFNQINNSDLKTITLLFKKNSSVVMEKMRYDKISVENDSEILQDIAKRNHKSPNEILYYFKN